MKKHFVAIIIVAFLFIPCNAAAMDWVNASVVVAWDPPTVYEDGTSILPTDGVITYDVVVKNMSTETALSIVDGISATEQQVNVNARGRWAIGIRAILTDGGAYEKSDYAWSDVVADCKDGNVFAIKLMGKPVKPDKLRVILNVLLGWLK